VGQHVSWWRVVFGAVSAWVDGLWFWAGWLDGDGPVALGAVDDTAFVAARSMVQRPTRVRVTVHALRDLVWW